MASSTLRKFFIFQNAFKTVIPTHLQLLSEKVHPGCLSRYFSATFCLASRSERGSANGSATSGHAFPNAEDQKLLKVAIIGEVNSGKSTLSNKLVGEKICAVTEVPHTTRQQTVGVFCEGNSQIVLLDTPGIVTFSEARKLKMSRQHMTAPENALLEADLIAVLHDVAFKKRRNRIHEEVLKVLETHQSIPSILVLNKVDTLKHKTELLGLAALLTEDRERDQWGYKEVGGWSKFDNVFMISARSGDGVQDLRDYFSARAKLSEWIYPVGIHTDQPLDDRIKEVFREIFLSLYEHEIPWQINQVTVLCKLKSNGQQRIHQKLYCRKKSQRRCVLEKIDILNKTATSELQKLFGCNVELSIDVTVRDKPAELLPRDDHFVGI